MTRRETPTPGARDGQPRHARRERLTGPLFNAGRTPHGWLFQRGAKHRTGELFERDDCVQVTWLRP